MQTAPLSLLGAAAATPLAQRTGETDRAQHEAAGRAQQAAAEKQAESAAGIGQTDSDHPTGDRDADGRRLWENSPYGTKQPSEEDAEPPQPSKDPAGESGGRLDLLG